MSRRSFARIAALATSALFVTLVAVAAGPQEKATSPTRPVEKAGPVPPPPPPNDSDTRSVTGPEAGVTAVIDKMVNAYDLKPQPLPAIPDDPPPHEGALIDLPYVVEPPDMILVEVLEALPGRPISGERLIRPDGRISLGFYGEVHVRGLTLPQVKVAIIKQMRKFISDDTLGLKDLVMLETTPAKPRNPGPLVLPPDGNPLDDPDRGRPAPSPANPNASLDGPTFRAASFATISGAAPIHFVEGLGSVQEGKENEKKAPEAEKEKKASEKAPNPIVIPSPGQGQVKITIEIQGQNAGVLVPFLPQKPEEAQIPPPESEGEQTWKITPPQDSERVFVDVTAYHSRNYYVLGDVVSPGRLPFTGCETVLDAIEYAGGLLPTAEPKEIRLVRPGRNGKPSKVYTVDLEAIQEKGDVRTNYQLFPGDRLIIGRNEIVKRTIEIDRLNAPIQEVVTSIRQNADMLKSLGALSPERSDQVLKDLVDFWAKEVARKGDIKFDEQTLREILLRELKRAPSASRPTPAPGAR